MLCPRGGANAKGGQSRERGCGRGAEAPPSRHRDWLDACARLFGGVDICGVEALRAPDGSERIVEQASTVSSGSPRQGTPPQQRPTPRELRSRPAPPSPAQQQEEESRLAPPSHEAPPRPAPRSHLLPLSPAPRPHLPPPSSDPRLNPLGGSLAPRLHPLPHSPAPKFCPLALSRAPRPHLLPLSHALKPRPPLHSSPAPRVHLPPPSSTPRLHPLGASPAPRPHLRLPNPAPKLSPPLLNPAPKLSPPLLNPAPKLSPPPLNPAPKLSPPPLNPAPNLLSPAFQLLLLAASPAPKRHPPPLRPAARVPRPRPPPASPAPRPHPLPLSQSWRPSWAELLPPAPPPSRQGRRGFAPCGRASPTYSPTEGHAPRQATPPFLKLPQPRVATATPSCPAPSWARPTLLPGKYRPPGVSPAPAAKLHPCDKTRAAALSSAHRSPSPCRLSSAPPALRLLLQLRPWLLGSAHVARPLADKLRPLPIKAPPPRCRCCRCLRAGGALVELGRGERLRPHRESCLRIPWGLGTLWALQGSLEALPGSLWLLWIANQRWKAAARRGLMTSPKRGRPGKAAIARGHHQGAPREGGGGASAALPAAAR
ncbi:synapsin-1 [Melanerpes formicivorus]|uniref:synapsin-1 n=1 Tax=Melanerpes formicivorus TaxID=211600 RepID=UPI003590172F